MWQCVCACDSVCVRACVIPAAETACNRAEIHGDALNHVNRRRAIRVWRRGGVGDDAVEKKLKNKKND